MKILVVDDYPLVRKGLVSTLYFEKDIQEIKEASSVNEAMTILLEFSPDIAVVDLRLGKEDGLEIVNRAKKENLKARFLIITSSLRKEDYLRVQEVGVEGYILKEAFVEDIIYAIHVIARGKKYFDPEMMQCIKSEEDEIKDLTPRERDVLLELGKGLNNTQIANRLYISENTVKKHIGSIFSKLRINHRVEAALFANNSIGLGH